MDEGVKTGPDHLGPGASEAEAQRVPITIANQQLRQLLQLERRHRLHAGPQAE